MKKKKKKAPKRESWCKLSGERRTIFPWRAFESLKRGSCSRGLDPRTQLLLPAQALGQPWEQGGSAGGCRAAPALCSEVPCKGGILIPYCRCALIHREWCLMTQCPLYTMTAFCQNTGICCKQSHTYIHEAGDCFPWG